MCSFLPHFLLLSSSTPFAFPSDVLAQWPVWVVFCVMMSWVNGQKYENLLQFIIQYIILDFVLASVTLAKTLH